MRIGRNKPCPCGSGKKYKKCCLDNDMVGSTIRQVSAEIDLDSFPPKIRGFDNVPDLKQWLEKALLSRMFDEDFNLQQLMNEEMQKYNQRISQVNSRLPKLYGDLLRDINVLIGGKKYEEAINLADTILEVFPESAEARELKDIAQISINNHPLQILFNDITISNKSEKKKLLKNFATKFKDSSVKAKDFVINVLYDYYFKNESWERKYLVMDIIKSVSFINWSEESTNKIDKLLLRALLDDDGRVRNNAFYCVSPRRGLDVPVNFFFSLYEAAKNEQSLIKQRSLCRAILDFVAPITDKTMYVAGESKAYKKAVDFALRITGYDPTYYKATPKEKMMIHFKDPKRAYRTRKAERN